MKLYLFQLNYFFLVEKKIKMGMRSKSVRFAQSQRW